MEHFSPNTLSIMNKTNIKTKSKFFKGWWTCTDCKTEPNALFIFGDNDIRKGCKGQAIIRNCPNSQGIPTKKLPSFSNSAYYTDTDLESNKRKILIAIEILITRIDNEKYSVIYFPADGLGTGLSKLDQKAPETLKFLNDIIFDVFGIKY